MFEECQVESGQYDFSLLSAREYAQYIEQLLKQMEPVFNWDEVDYILAPTTSDTVPAFLVSFAKDKPLVIREDKDSFRGPLFGHGRFLVVSDSISSFDCINRSIESQVGCECAGAASFIFKGNREDLNSQEYGVYFLSRKEQPSVCV